MSEITIDALGQATGDFSNHEKHGFDLGAYVGDLAFEEDSGCEDISLEGLQQELEECQTDEVVANILSSGAKLREYAKGVENNLRKVELDSIQIRDCDGILSQMETLLSGFQEEICSISSDIKILQEKSMDMGLRLKNRRVAESKLAKFVEDIIVPPKMIGVIVDGEVNEEYMRTLEILSKKLKFVEADPAVKSSKALKDVEPELEKLRQKAISKVYDFIVQKLIALRKPKTNIQILQQSVLLKYKYIISFLKEHGKEVFMDVRAAYIDTMNKVLSAHFRAYIQALEKLQLDIATAYDLIGVETRSTGIFSRAREPLKNRSAVFALGDRIKILKVAESKLAKFVEDTIVPPKMIDVIVDGEVNEEYMRTLEILSKKLKFVEADPAVKSSKALKDVEPELEKLRQKAISKVCDFIVQKLIALRKPKTNIQILQQSVLLKYKYIISFLKEHGKEVFMDVRAAYIDTKVNLFPNLSESFDQDLSQPSNANSPAKKQKTSSHSPDVQNDSREEAIRDPSLERPYLCTGYDIFLLWEPCTMCAMALVHQRVKRIFYAFPNPTAGGLGSVHRLQGEKSLNLHYAVFRVLLPDNAPMSSTMVQNTLGTNDNCIKGSE